MKRKAPECTTRVGGGYGHYQEVRVLEAKGARIFPSELYSKLLMWPYGTFLAPDRRPGAPRPALITQRSLRLAPAEPETRKMMAVPVPGLLCMLGSMHSLPVSADAGAFRREEHRLSSVRLGVCAGVHAHASPTASDSRLTEGYSDISSSRGQGRGYGESSP